MPLPVAEAFIDHRKRHNIDLIREQMIGMIFTGQPLPLGTYVNTDKNILLIFSLFLNKYIKFYLEKILILKWRIKLGILIRILTLHPLFYL